MSERPDPPDPGVPTRTGSYIVAVGMGLIGAALIAFIVWTASAPDIDTGIDNRCDQSDDNQYACWRAAEAAAPDTTPGS